MTEILIISLSVLVFLLLAFLFAFYFSFYYTFKRHKKEPPMYYNLDGEDKHGRKAFSRKVIDDFLALTPSEEVEIKSHDGLSLHARLYMKDEKAPFEIAFHGYRGIAERDFSGGGMESLIRYHNLLLVDQRAHGKSEGEVISFGILERLDVLSWTRYVAEKYPENERILLGLSMGAASVLMASDLPLENVSCILADCPYSSPERIIKKVISDMHLPRFIFYPILRLSAKISGKFDLESADAVSSVKKSEIPILIVHGQGDKFVPVEMSREIKKANPKIKLVEFPDAPHGLSYIYDRDRYAGEMTEFIKENLKGKGRKK